ncbi:hypothetical protein K1719_031437 [Acacia pycnantha]|nr:hypothetical protein K1719_031437 [Acacia pycnantha]
MPFQEYPTTDQGQSEAARESEGKSRNRQRKSFWWTRRNWTSLASSASLSSHVWESSEQREDHLHQTQVSMLLHFSLLFFSIHR